MGRENAKPNIVAYSVGYKTIAVAPKDQPREPLLSERFENSAAALAWFMDHLRKPELKGVDPDSLRQTAAELIRWVEKEGAEAARKGHIDGRQLRDGSVITVGERKGTRVFVVVDLSAHPDNKTFHHHLLTARVLCELDRSDVPEGVASIRGQLENMGALRSPLDALDYVVEKRGGEFTDHLDRAFRVTVRDKKPVRPGKRPTRTTKAPAVKKRIRPKHSSA